MSLGTDLRRISAVMLYNVFQTFVYINPRFIGLWFDLSCCRVAVAVPLASESQTKEIVYEV